MTKYRLVEKTSKWRNKPTWRDGYRFDSIKEAEYYDQLNLQKKAGIVSFFLRQVPIHLSGGEHGGKRLYVDFMVFYADSTVRFIDVKGKATEKWLTQKAWAEKDYPILIETV